MFNHRHIQQRHATAVQVAAVCPKICFSSEGATSISSSSLPKVRTDGGDRRAGGEEGGGGGGLMSSPEASRLFVLFSVIGDENLPALDGADHLIPHLGK